MDKVRILQSVKRSKIMDGLDIDEAKLYLILLANSRENGDGNILLKSINGVIGEEFSIAKLKAVCRKLEKCELIEVTASSLEQVKGDDSKLAYRITSEKQRGIKINPP